MHWHLITTFHIVLEWNTLSPWCMQCIKTVHLVHRSSMKILRSCGISGRGVGRQQQTVPTSRTKCCFLYIKPHDKVSHPCSHHHLPNHRQYSTKTNLYNPSSCRRQCMKTCHFVQDSDGFSYAKRHAPTRSPSLIHELQIWRQMTLTKATQTSDENELFYHDTYGGLAPLMTDSNGRVGPGQRLQNSTKYQ